MITETQAVAQLQESTDALTGADPSLDVTNELRELVLAMPALDAADRRQARAILARPPANDGGGEPFGGEWPCPETGGSSNCSETFESANFVVHWPVIADCAAPAQDCDEPSLVDTTPANGVPDYVEQVVDAAEESYVVQNTGLGWPQPKPDGTKGGNAKVDIYLADICDETGGVCVFGYASPDDNSPQCTSGPFRCFAYLVLDNDYQVNEFGYAEPGVPLRVTTAHEYNHILQFRLDSNQDVWMFESTAVWAEHKVFPGDDDWVETYMGAWARGSRLSLTSSNAGGGLRIYGSCVWNHWLDSQYGPETVLRAWQLSRAVSPKDFGVGAYDEAIEEAVPNYGFPPVFTKFAAATSEWRSAVADFPRANEMKNVKRRGKLTLGADRKRIKLDNTSYQLLRVDPRSASDLKLRVTAPDGLQAGIALVGREGPVLNPVNVVSNVKQIRGNGSGSVKLGGAQAFDRITAVVVNADGRVEGSKPRFGQFRYRRNDQELTAKLR